MEKPSKIIAISAVSAAICGTLVTLGSYLGDFDFSFFLFAGIALTIPLYRNSEIGCILAYFAGGFIGLLLSGMNFFVVVPFLVWFGIHPLLGCLLARHGVKKWLAFLIKLALFEVAIFVMLQFTTMLVVDVAFLTENTWLFYLIGAAFFVFYDWMIIYLVKYLFNILGRIIKR